MSSAFRASSKVGKSVFPLDSQLILHETDMSVTVDPDGAVTGAMVQCMAPLSVLEPLFDAFLNLGWEVPDDGSIEEKNF
jgi:hypothetical protein